MSMLHICVSSAAEEEKGMELMLRGVPERCCQSFLWEQSVRDNVTENKISEQVIYHFHTIRKFWFALCMHTYAWMLL